MITRSFNIRDDMLNFFQTCYLLSIEIMRVISFALFLSMLFSPMSYATVNGLSVAETKKYQQDVLDEVNAYRLSKHRQPLVMNELISQKATQHSMKMATHQVQFSHEQFFDRIKHIKMSIKNFGGGAENIACYKIPPKEVVRKWLTSPEHRKNILGSYNTTGIGVFKNKSGWVYYTQIFVQDNDHKS